MTASRNIGSTCHAPSRIVAAVACSLVITVGCAKDDVDMRGTGTASGNGADDSLADTQQVADAAAPDSVATGADVDTENANDEVQDASAVIPDATTDVQDVPVAVEADVGQPDLAPPDAPPLVDVDAADTSDPIDPPQSCQGKCGTYDAKAKCQCDAPCIEFKNCCSDWAALCDPCKGKPCNDGNPCTPDTCDSATGNCKFGAFSVGLSCGATASCAAGLAADKALLGHWSFDGCDGKDASSHGHHGTVQGKPACVEGPAGKALQLGGTAWLEVANTDALSVKGAALSMGGWVKLDGPAEYTILISKEKSYLTGFAPDGMISAMQTQEPGGWKWLGTAPIKPGEWHHTAVVYDGKSVLQYLDGKLASYYPLAGNLTPAPCGLGIGARYVGCGTPGQKLNGSVDEVFLFGRALLASEVKALHANAWQAGCAPIVPPCTQQADCNDHNPCTADTCKAGACSHGFAADGTACSDGNDCTTADACVAGACVGKSKPPCPASTDPCLLSYCAKNGGTCVDMAQPDGSACASGGTCTAGKCVAAQPPKCSKDGDCSDGNACTADACDPQKGCKAPVAAADGTACGSGLACAAGVCKAIVVAGLCGSDADCDDKQGCTVDKCDPAKGCLHTDLADKAACDDANTCTTGTTCAAGICGGGTPANAGGKCTTLHGNDGVCKSGECSDCEPGSTCPKAPGGCSVAICYEKLSGPDWDPAKAAHLCEYEAAKDGEPCPGGTCAAGLCVPKAGAACAKAADCDDTNPCTKDECGAGAKCSHVALPDKTACNGGECTGGRCIWSLKWSGPCWSVEDCASSGSCLTDNCTQGRCRPNWKPSKPKPFGATCLQDGGKPGYCVDQYKCVGCMFSSQCQPPSGVNAVCYDCKCEPWGSCACDYPTFSTCDDGNPCTEGDKCGGGFGGNFQCEGKPVADGAPCGGGKVCKANGPFGSSCQ